MQSGAARSCTGRPPVPWTRCTCTRRCFAALFALLTLLPPIWGYALWMALHFLFLPVAVIGAARLCGRQEWPATRRLVTLVMAALIVPVLGDLQEGQSNLLVMALVTAGLLLVERQRPVAGGILLAAAVHLKVVPVVLLPVLLLQRRRRAAAAMALAMLGWAVVPCVWTMAVSGPVTGAAAGAGLHAAYAEQVLWEAVGLRTIGGAEQYYVLNNSLLAVAHRWFGQDVAFSPFPELRFLHGPLLVAVPRPVLTTAALLLGGALVAAALALSRRAAFDAPGRAAGAGLAIIALQMSGPTFWEHHLVSATLLLAAVEARWGARVAWLLATPLLLTLTIPYVLFVAGALAGIMEWTSPIGASRTWGAPTLAVLVLWAGTWRAFRLPAARRRSAEEETGRHLDESVDGGQRLGSEDEPAAATVAAPITAPLSDSRRAIAARPS